MSREQDRVYTAVDMLAAELRGAVTRGSDEWQRAETVVRCVRRAQGRRSDLSRPGDVPKVSAAEFARKVSAHGYGPNCLTRILDAWDRAAEDHQVPPADEVSPGQGVDRTVWSFPPDVRFGEYKEPGQTLSKKKKALKGPAAAIAISNALGHTYYTLHAAMRADDVEPEYLEDVDLLIERIEDTIKELQDWLAKMRAVEV